MNWKIVLKEYDPDKGLSDEDREKNVNARKKRRIKDIQNNMKIYMKSLSEDEQRMLVLWLADWAASYGISD